MIELTRYTKRYTYQGPIDFIIIILLLSFIGIMYIFLAKANYDFAGFILVSIATLAVIYWAFYIRKATKREKNVKYTMEKTQEKKDWVYDLIKGDEEVVFVAEVPGPEEAVSVRLINGILYIKGGQGFMKEVSLDLDEEMSIAEFRYRNGIMTLKIKRIRL